MSEDEDDYRRLIEPVLALLRHTEQYVSFDNVAEGLIEALDVSASELEQMLPSGRQTVFDNQLNWALSYLERDLLIETNGANAYRITSLGRSGAQGENAGATAPASFLQVPEPARVSGMAEGNAEQSGPRKIIAEQFDVHYKQLKQDLAKQIQSQSPAFFENLIIDLLLSMGYGDRRRDLVAHLGRTGDGGVDGAIKQDQLGLDVVYVQAKRYRPGLVVPVSAVRDFAGAIDAHKANKGIFVTTSHFTRSGHDFISAISNRIVLIDGDRLCSLLIRNKIGVRIIETYEIKQIDRDYFK